MYALEQVVDGSGRVVYQTNDRAELYSILSLIFKERAHTAGDRVTSEYFRAARHRILSGLTFDEILTIEGEHFRIRTANSSSSPSEVRSFRRVARSTPRQTHRQGRQSSAAAAVNTSREETKPEYDRVLPPVDERTVIDGERFEI